MNGSNTTAELQNRKWVRWSGDLEEEGNPGVIVGLMTGSVIDQTNH